MPKLIFLQISVIIVNYNVKYFLEQCLLSVLAATKNITAEVFVVDNNSTDGSLSYLKPKFTWVNFIENKTNIGFAKANNLALAKAKGNFILFLNPDTLISEYCIINTMAFLSHSNNRGATGIYMIDGTGNYLPESKRAFPSPLISLYKLFGFAKLFPYHKKFASYYLGHLPENENNEIDVLSGAFILIKKEVINKTKGFDENFFMYGEDIDLSYRIQKLGFKNYCFVENPIVHFKGESTKKNNVFYLKTFYKAMEQFVSKHYDAKASKAFAQFLKIGIWLRATIALLINFLKLAAPIILDISCLSISVAVNLFFAKYIYEISVNNYLLFITAAIFFTGYLLLNAITNKYLVSINIQKLFVNTVLCSLLTSAFILLFYHNSGDAFLWLQIALLFFLLRYTVSLRLIKAEMLPHYQNNPLHEQLLIVGSISEFNKVSNILKKNNLGQIITGRVSVTDNDSYLSVGLVNNLPLVVKNYPIKEIVFVASNALTYCKIINLIATLPRNMQFYFYNAKAGAIISSYSKNSSGQVIVA